MSRSSGDQAVRRVVGRSDDRRRLVGVLGQVAEDLAHRLESGRVRLEGAQPARHARARPRRRARSGRPATPVNWATIEGPDTKANASAVMITTSASAEHEGGPEITGPVTAASTGTIPEQARSRRRPAPSRAARRSPRRRRRRSRTSSSTRRSAGCSASAGRGRQRLAVLAPEGTPAAVGARNGRRRPVGRPGPPSRRRWCRRLRPRAIVQRRREVRPRPVDRRCAAGRADRSGEGPT